MKTRPRSVCLFCLRCGLLPLLAVVLLTHAEFCTQAQAVRKATDPADKRITLDLYDVSMGEALTACCQQAGYRYHISQAIKGFVARERRTLRMQAVPFKTAFDAIVSPGVAFGQSYSYHQSGDVFTIEGPTVTFESKQANSAEVLKALLEAVGVNYVVPTEAFGAAPMDFVVSRLPLEQALKLFLARVHFSKPLTYAVSNGVLIFSYKTAAARGPRVPEVDPAENSRAGQVMVKFLNVERLEGLHALFQALGINYSINLPLQGKLFIETEGNYHGVLAEILHGAEAGITYMVQDGVFTIVRKSVGE